VEVVDLPPIKWTQTVSKKRTLRKEEKIMNEKKHRIYTDEFKREALELLKIGTKSGGQIERDLGITPGLLGKWRDRYQVVAKANAPASLEPSDIEAAKREIRRLQKELMEIAEEREILKKVVNIFSRRDA
jgi:transposase